MKLKEIFEATLVARKIAAEIEENTKFQDGDILLEGGWASTVTQSTKLFPHIARAAAEIMRDKFERDFNKFLKSEREQPIKIGKTVGSSAYFHRDSIAAPTKEYGDIDIIFTIPRVQGTSAEKNKTHYQELVKAFIAQKQPDYIFKPEGAAFSGQNVIIKIGDDWVQVDLIATFPELEDWTTHRMTPEHGLKGALLGFMYSALAETLNLSIAGMGVQAKHVGDSIVPFKKQKVDHIDTVSTDFGKFIHHIFDYFYNRARTDARQTAVPNKPKIPAALQKNSGMNRDDIKTADLVAAIKGLARAFGANNMFGHGDLKHISNEDDFLRQVKRSYEEKISKAVSATKFDKAETESARARAEATKDTLRSKSTELMNLLT